MEQERYELPDGWEWKKLEDIATTTSGGTPSRSKKEYWNGHIPWIKSGELNDSFIETNSEFITDEGLHNSSCNLLPKGSLLMAMYGATAGRLGILAFDAAVNQAVCCIQNNSEITERDFIKYYLLSKRKQIIQDSFGGAQPNISQKYIRSLNIPCPNSLPEQRRIADKLDAVLGRIDDAIRLSQDNLASLDDLFASLLQQAFNPLGKTSKETRYELPDGWEWKKLSVIAPPSRQTLLPVSEQQYNYIGLEHIVPNSAKLTDFSPVDGQTIASTKNIFSRNMVLFGKLRPYLRKVHVAQFDGIASTEIIPFQCTAAILPEYLAHFMRSDFFINLAVDNCSGSRMPRVTTRFLQTLAFVPLPPLPEQRHIADKLDALSGKIAMQKRAIEEKLDELNHLKSSVLDAAFRGRL